MSSNYSDVSVWPNIYQSRVIQQVKKCIIKVLGIQIISLNLSLMLIQIFMLLMIHYALSFEEFEQAYCFGRDRSFVCPSVCVSVTKSKLQFWNFINGFVIKNSWPVFLLT